MNIYVGNLNYRVGDDDLKEIFSEYGDVISARIIMDKATGRSRGFGFVEMEDVDGRRALDELNGVEVQGRELKVSEARVKDRQQGGGNRGGGNRRFNNRDRDSRREY
jgi:RNA recognition motif-containing protein